MTDGSFQPMPHGNPDRDARIHIVSVADLPAMLAHLDDRDLAELLWSVSDAPRPIFDIIGAEVVRRALRRMAQGEEGDTR
jgi:hypothetical protein